MSIADWWRQRRPAAAGPAAGSGGGERWLVLDVESSGLDPQRDALLSIAAVALRQDGPRLHIALGDSFEVTLRRDVAVADKPNVVVHGIGIGAQRAGTAPEVALQAFAAFADDSPLIGYHSTFDRTLIERAQRSARLPVMRNPWLDLAELAPVLCPAAAHEPPRRALDDWLAHFAIPCVARHQAAADALATGELLLRLWPAALAQGAAPGFKPLARLAAARRWLPA